MIKCRRVLPVMIIFFAISFFYPAGLYQGQVLKGNICHAGSFLVGQVSGNQSGTIKRHINISSPWSGGYIYEDFHAVGKVEVRETFRMGKIGPGAEDLFDSESKGNPGPDTGGHTGSGTGNNPGSGTKNSPASQATEIVELVASANLKWRDLF